jgi:hypothetical protein
MPYFTLNRNYALSTTKGHSVNFKKGEKTWVPEGIIAEAVAIGAIPEVPIDVLPPDTPERKQIADEELRAKVFAAFEKMLLRNARGDFSASGTPNPKKLEEMVGVDLPQKLRDALWVDYNTMKSEEANQA